MSEQSTPDSALTPVTIPEELMHKILENHRRQQRILEKSGGIVIGYHHTSTQSASTILEEGFIGTNSFTNPDGLLYLPQNAVWFYEETELSKLLVIASAKYRNNFSVIKAQLRSPSIDPTWRPCWVVDKYKSGEDERIKIQQITIYTSKGSIEKIQYSIKRD